MNLTLGCVLKETFKKIQFIINRLHETFSENIIHYFKGQGYHKFSKIVQIYLLTFSQNITVSYLILSLLIPSNFTDPENFPLVLSEIGGIAWYYFKMKIKVPIRAIIRFALLRLV